MSRPLSPAAQAVRLPLDQIMGRLHQYSRISFSATDTLPITIETNEAGLQALIDALFAAALRSVADQVVPEMEHPEAEEWLGQSAWLQAEASVRFRLLAIAAELEGGTSTSSTH